MAEAAQVATIATAKNSVLVRMAERFGVDANKLHATLKATAFRGEVSNEQFMALMIVADQYGLNPLTKELYAFPDKNNGIVPVVGIDGWARIINEHPQCNGLEFIEAPTMDDAIPQWIECVIHRKDREHPTRVREYFSECKRGTQPWGSHPRRMLRHKALIQCARLAFGFVGIYDDDEAQRIIEGGVTIVPDSGEAVNKLNAEITGKGNGTVIDVDGDPEPQTTKSPPKQPAPVQESEPAEATKDNATLQAGVTLAKVLDKMQVAHKAKDVELLDAHADLIRSLPKDHQGEARAEYQRLRGEVAQ